MSVIDRIRTALGNKDNKDRNVENKELSRFEWLVYSDEDPGSRRRQRHRNCLIVSAGVIAAGITAFCIASALGGNSSAVERLTRSSEGYEQDLHLELEYSGSVLEKDISVSVLPRHIGADDAEKLFDECEEWIKTQFSEGKWFPSEAPNGVSLTWQEDDLAFLGGSGSENKVTAQLGAGEYCRVSEFVIPDILGEDEYLRGLEALSEKLSDDLGRNDEGDGLSLPADSQGARLSWSFPGKNTPVLVIPACVFAAVFVWLSRDDPEKRMYRKRLDAFEKEIPAMSFQVMLLLNAGLIAESAFIQFTEQTSSEQGPLYRIFREIRQRSVMRNVSFINELYSFAKESHCASLLRFSSLVYEHASRGASLADKLEQERSMMLGSRLGSARAKVREAETKLCLPLILLLIALIIITAAPSFMAM